MSDTLRVVCMFCSKFVRGDPDSKLVSHGLCEPCAASEFQKLGLKRKQVVELPYPTLPPLEDLTKIMTSPLEFELRDEASTLAFEEAANALGPFEGANAWESKPGVLTLKLSSPAGFKDLLGALAFRETTRADDSRELARSLLDSVGFRWV